MNDSLYHIIVNKLIKMEKHLQELSKYRPASFQEYNGNNLIKYSMERIIQLIIDLALDINNIIIKSKGKYPAADYFNSFIELIELGVLEEDFANNIAPSTGLRNRLVHEYEKVDDRIVYESIEKVYNYYIEYLKKIRNNITRNEKE